MGFVYPQNFRTCSKCPQYSRGQYSCRQYLKHLRFPLKALYCDFSQLFYPHFFLPILFTDFLFSPPLFQSSTTRLNMRGVPRQEWESARYRGRKRKRNSNSRSNSRSPSQGLFFYSPKKSYLSIVGPLGLSGSLFLGLLVFDFYQPTNRDLYLVGGG